MGVIEVNFVYSDGSESTMFMSDDYKLSLPADTMKSGDFPLKGIEILRYYPEGTFDATL